MSEARTQSGAVLTGLAVARGFAAGPVFLYRGESGLAVPVYEVPAERTFAEVARYHAARAATHRQLEAFIERFKTSGGGVCADVFTNHLLILEDKMMVAAIERRITEERVNAEAAIRRAVDEFRSVFGRMADPYLRERLRDVDDIERRLLRALTGDPEAAGAPAAITEPVIVVAEDLTPSETISLPREFILGFATDHGSTTSHVALLARALGIPSVVGLRDITRRVKGGETVLLDGTNGTVTVNPDDAARAAFDRQTRQERDVLAFLADEGDAAEASGESSAAADIRFCANVQPGVPLESLAENGAQGIGLYRSEYLWLSGADDPTEEEQAAAYRAAAAAARGLGGGARAVFRALDLGGDKLKRGQKAAEANPFLGNRSIRYLLSHRDVFRTQLRAILRASAAGPSAVMFPLVATLEELRAANEELARVKDDLRAEGVPFDERLPHGVMIEVPSAALAAEAFAKECDFFSIGTNDLVQYTLAADRANERVSHLYQPLHPAVVRLVDLTVRAADAAGIPVAVCGESASDPMLAALWAGLGVRELSMSAGYIPVLRKTLRSVTRAEVRDLADRVRAALPGATAADIAALCRAFVLEKIPRLEELQSFFTAGT